MNDLKCYSCHKPAVYRCLACVEPVCEECMLPDMHDCAALREEEDEDAE